MSKKSTGKIIITMLMSLIMCFNILLLPANADEKSEELKSTNSNIEVIIKSDKGEIKNGDHLNFNLEYKAKNGYGSINPGDQISFKIPSWMKGIKFNFPPQHFKDSKIDGDTIVATFGDDAKKALGGYISVSGTADNIITEKIETIQVKVNGVVVGSENIVVTPKDKINDGDNKPSILNRKILKDVDEAVGYDSEGNIISNVYFPALGKVKEYTIYVNEEYSYMYNVRLMDKMPEGMELVTDSLKVEKIDLSNNTKDVTKDVHIYKDSKQLDIAFGNINSKYIVRYKAKITKESDKYINIANLYVNNDSLTSTVVVNNKKEKTRVLEKQSYDTEQVTNDKNETINVASNGEGVKYRIVLNRNKVCLENVKLEDFIPKGMTFVPESLRIGRYDKENNFSWVSDKFKDKINYENDKVTIDFGNIEDYYIIYYDTKIKDVEREYNNKAVVSYDNTTKESIDKVYYKINAGAINAYKAVDKKEIKKGDNQTVVYSINFESFGIFEKGYLSVVDKLNNNVKIIKIEAPEHFTVDIDKNTNTVKVVNDKKEVGYGENLEIKIYTDFKDVENGTTISNTANINNRPTNEVETKKGYAFKGVKVDSEDENLRLKGAKFLLKDKNKQTIKSLVSDENGIIQSELDTWGTYYIEEIEAPKGYSLKNKDIEFMINEDNIGQIIRLDNIENKKLKEVEETSEEIKEEEVTNIDDVKEEKIDSEEVKDDLVTPKVTKPEMKVDETSEETKEEEVTNIDDVKEEKIDSEEVKDDLVTPKVTKPEMKVDETSEETKEEEVTNIDDVKEEKIDSEEVKDDLVTPKVTKPEMKVDETSEETKEEEVTNIDDVKEEKIDSEEVKDDLVTPKVPDEKPPVPEEKPKVPDEKPSVPEEKPEVPDEKPSVPEEKPEVPDEKPSVPEEKPEVPDEKPSVPEEKPEVPDEKPSVPEEKPEVPDEKPSVPQEKPEVPDEKPSVPDEKPSVPDEKPSVPEEKPKVPDEKPSVPEEKPKVPDEEIKNTNSPKTGDLSLAPNAVISVVSISTLYILNKRKFKDK